jgi:hypothetical protein
MQLIEKGSREDKGLFYLFSCMFALEWLASWGNMLVHWHALASHSRGEIIFFTVTFLALWLNALRERVTGISMALISVAFVAAGRIILQAF